MSFLADHRHWRNHVEFASHLNQHNPSVCSWVNGVVVHHTYRPLRNQWNGSTSVKGIQQYYQSLGWKAGPHLFICFGSRNPLNDGIFQLTPLNLRGIHAGRCNSHTIGIEVVGDYDTEPWPEALSDEVCKTIAHFVHWRGVDVVKIVGHRDCNSPKTCPGRKIDMNIVRSEVKRFHDLMY